MTDWLTSGMEMSLSYFSHSVLLTSPSSRALSCSAFCSFILKSFICLLNSPGRKGKDSIIICKILTLCTYIQVGIRSTAISQGIAGLSGQQSLSQVKAYVERCKCVTADIVEPSRNLAKAALPAIPGTFVTFLQSLPHPTPFTYSLHWSKQGWQALGKLTHSWVAEICQPWGWYSIWGLARCSGAPWYHRASSFNFSETASVLNESNLP